jgi:hypothetical protein
VSGIGGITKAGPDPGEAQKTSGRHGGEVSVRERVEGGGQRHIRACRPRLDIASEDHADQAPERRTFDQLGTGSGCRHPWTECGGRAPNGAAGHGQAPTFEVHRAARQAVQGSQLHLFSWRKCGTAEEAIRRRECRRPDDARR